MKKLSQAAFDEIKNWIYRNARPLDLVLFQYYFDYRYLSDKVPIMVCEKIKNETDNFMANPLEFILSPNSRFYEENKKEVNDALDLLIDQRPESGAWGIPWEWYNNDKYPKAFAISENWWKASKAIEKLLQLKSFGRKAYE